MIQMERSGTDCQAGCAGEQIDACKGRTGKSTSVSESPGQQQRKQQRQM